MLRTFSAIGDKLTSLLGEPTAHETASISQSFPLFSGDALAAVLPWQTYDPERGLFFCKNSVGFTIEAIPLVGATSAIQKELSSLYQEILEEGESLQCLLWADHRIAPILNKWEEAHRNKSEIHHQIAQKRAHFYQTAHHVHSRTFRCIISLSAPSQNNSLPFTKLKEKKEKILKTLRSFTYAFSWDIDHFLEKISALITYSSSREVQKRHWNPYQSLANQLPQGGILKIEADHLLWETETTNKLKTFRVVDYPSTWSLDEMQNLIGDLFRDAFRLHTPFFLHYGVHLPNQNKEERRFKKRAHFIEKQGQSGWLLRFIPQLKEELKELEHIRTEYKGDARFVSGRFH